MDRKLISNAHTTPTTYSQNKLYLIDISENPRTESDP